MLATSTFLPLPLFCHSHFSPTAIPCRCHLFVPTIPLPLALLATATIFRLCHSSAIPLSLFSSTTFLLLPLSCLSLVTATSLPSFCHCHCDVPLTATLLPLSLLITLLPLQLFCLCHCHLSANTPPLSLPLSCQSPFCLCYSFATAFLQPRTFLPLPFFGHCHFFATASFLPFQNFP